MRKTFILIWALLSICGLIAGHATKPHKCDEPSPSQGTSRDTIQTVQEELKKCVFDISSWEQGELPNVPITICEFKKYLNGRKEKDGERICDIIADSVGGAGSLSHTDGEAIPMVELGLIIQQACTYSCDKCASIMMCARNKNCAYSGERQCHDTRSPTRSPTHSTLGDDDFNMGSVQAGAIKTAGIPDQANNPLRKANLIIGVLFLVVICCGCAVVKLWKDNCYFCKSMRDIHSLENNMQSNKYASESDSESSENSNSEGRPPTALNSRNSLFYELAADFEAGAVTQYGGTQGQDESFLNVGVHGSGLEDGLTTDDDMAMLRPAKTVTGGGRSIVDELSDDKPLSDSFKAIPKKAVESVYDVSLEDDLYNPLRSAVIHNMYTDSYAAPYPVPQEKPIYDQVSSSDSQMDKYPGLSDDSLDTDNWDED